MGDLLPLARAEFVTGAESQAETGELHAATIASPRNSQSYTSCFAFDHLEGEDHTIEKPSEYAFWRSYVPQLTPPWTGSLLSWTRCDPQTLAKRAAFFDPDPKSASQRALNLWTYRRIADQANFTAGAYRSSITLVNWLQNDCWPQDLVTISASQKSALLMRAKQLSLALLYWMQTKAHRPDGEQGWKGLRLRRDLVGTQDGLAKTAYVRESCRIRAEFTVREQHVGTAMIAQATRVTLADTRAASFADSVGMGSYRIDLHPSAGATNYLDVSSVPFQIPLGALIPMRLENLLPACKNIGTTHITNGCYRLHPVEWNIGEAAGALAAYCVQIGESARAVYQRSKRLADFQSQLLAQGFELDGPRLHPL